MILTEVLKMQGSWLRPRVAKVLFLLVLILLPLFLGGCWDATEIEDLGIVLAIGFDTGPHNDVLVTAQTIVPSALKGGGGGGGGGPVYRNFASTGRSVYDAVRRMDLIAPRRLYFAQSQVVLVTERFARQRGVKGIMDFIERSPQFRRTNWFLVVRGATIGDILDVAAPVEKIPAMRIKHIIEQMKLTSLFDAKDVGKFLEAMGEEGIQPYTATAMVEPAQIGKPLGKGGGGKGGGPGAGGQANGGTPARDIRIEGTAVFNRDKMVGWLDGIESRGLMWIRGEVKGGEIFVPCPSNPQKTFSLQIIASNSGFHGEISDGRLVFKVQARVKLNVREVTDNVNIADVRALHKLEAVAAKEVTREIRAALNKVQHTYRTDVFGFGQDIYRHYPEVWKDLRGRWDEEFPDVPVEVRVQATINRTGLIGEPVSAR